MQQLAGGQDGQVRPLPGMREFSSLQLYPEDSARVIFEFNVKFRWTNVTVHDSS